MNHPSHETWMAYLYDELPPSGRAEADAHLQTCPECRESLARWRSTMSALDGDVVAVPRRPAAQWHPAIPWAAAACLTLWAGFGAGRLMGPSRAEMQAEIARVREAVTADLRDQYREDLREVARASVAASAVENRELVTRVVGEFNAARLADRRDWLANLERLEGKHETQYGVLRAGMLDLARSTRSGFRQTEDNLNLLATYLPAEDNDESFPKAGSGKDK